MARLPRLAMPGHAHYVIQRAHGSIAATGVFTDAEDRNAFLAALRTAAQAHPVQIHAYALLPDELQLLATPAEAGALSRLVQDVGRRYVSAYNRRHAHRGSLWDGRYRAAVVEPGALRLAALRLVDGATPEPQATSAGHRTGGQHNPLLTDPPEWWQLGNTPFDREGAYGELLERGVDLETADHLRRAALGGWAAGSAQFVADVASAACRPARPRAAGRPTKRFTA